MKIMLASLGSVMNCILDNTNDIEVRIKAANKEMGTMNFIQNSE